MLTFEQRRERDDKLIHWVGSFLRKNRYAPSVREIGAAFGLSSTSTTADWLSRLRREGRVNWREGETRTLHVVKPKRHRSQ